MQHELFESDFQSLVKEIQSCKSCARMDGCTRVISWANGNVTAPLMFIGEAPGRLGADRTAIPFHGDKSGDNFELLLSTANLSRQQIFVTNAVLCNPRDEKGNNAPPNKQELRNCAKNLKKQIDLIQPKMIMTLGTFALEATRLIDPHDLVLREAVRTKNRWYGRLLLPLYHPGARAMIHRNYAKQVSDYYFVAETFRKIDKKPKKKTTSLRGSEASWGLVEYLLRKMGEVSLFRLHKILYLLDLESRKRFNVAATNFYYIRQKDGPYCVELGGKWYKRFENNLKVKNHGQISLIWESHGLFDPKPDPISDELTGIVSDVLNRTEQMANDRLKTLVYLTIPMKKYLKQEKLGHSTLNMPLFA